MSILRSPFTDCEVQQSTRRELERNRTDHFASRKGTAAVLMHAPLSHSRSLRFRFEDLGLARLTRPLQPSTAKSVILTGQSLGSE